MSGKYSFSHSSARDGAPVVPIPPASTPLSLSHVLLEFVPKEKRPEAIAHAVRLRELDVHSGSILLAWWQPATIEVAA